MILLLEVIVAGEVVTNQASRGSCNYCFFLSITTVGITEEANQAQVIVGRNQNNLPNEAPSYWNEETNTKS
jgi:hypothetical protein